ncbi:MAG: Abi family protein [Streptococcus sp.]|nr:MAG: Abi family protein [Streptococcus sp.]
MTKRKELLTYPQLLSKMSDIGIGFNEWDTEQAIEFLQEKNYYYKVSSYRKLFPKIDGKYNIEFSTLADIAVIDMRLRYLLLGICLDIEHSIKTAIMDIVTKTPRIDGYDIVKDYAVYNPQGYNNTINALSKNAYLKNIYLKHHQDIPIWVLVEVMDFGNICYFIEMYCKKYPSNKRLKKAKQFSSYARHIRNACAHSNVLLVDMLNQKLKQPSAVILSLGESFGLDRSDLRYRKLHDIFSLIILHREYCGDKLKRHRRLEAIELAKRSKRYMKYYEENEDLKKIYQILCKILVKQSKT